MTETILRLLTRLSEAGDDAILPGELAAPFFGPVFDRLLAKRVLVEQAPLADWEVCDACECGLPCRPIRKAGDGYRAECPLDRRHDVDLTAPITDASAAAPMRNSRRSSSARRQGS